MEEFAANYSRGMKKKLALTCAMVHDPVLLILDEPTNGLDPFATRALHQIIRAKAAEGKTIFYSTHLLDQAEKLCTRIGIFGSEGSADGARAATRSARPALNRQPTGEIFFSLAGRPSERERNVNSSPPLSSVRAVSVIGRLALRRQLNILQRVRLRRRPNGAVRVPRGAHRKSQRRSIFGGFLFLVMIFNGYFISSHGL